MATYLTTTSELTAVADAIRAKAGTQSALTYPSEFVSTISAISTGGGVPTLSCGAVVDTFTDSSVNGNTIQMPYAVTFYGNPQEFGNAFKVNGLTGTGMLPYFLNLHTVSFDDPSAVTVIPDSFMDGCNHATLPTQVVFNNVTGINQYAFRGVGGSLQSDAGTIDLKLPSVTYVSGSSFSSVYYLRSIEIGTNIQTIGSDINRYNTYLEAITILGTPSSINSNAFRGAGTSSSVLNVVWSEGTVANAPWGFTGTINYDYVPTP